MHPTLTVLLYSSLAAATAGLGTTPLLFRDRPPLTWLGWSNAMAAGLMLGAAYILMASAAGLPAPPVAAGAGFGIGFVLFTHAASGTEDLELNRLAEAGTDYRYQVLLVHTLHAAPEGIAIGVAMTLTPGLGGLMALAIAVHNIPEATILSAILTSGGLRRLRAAALAVMTNVGQVLLAVVTYAIIAAAPAVQPWALGFAVGALAYLVMAELLPECYHQAGATSVAVGTIVAMGIVVLLASGL